MIAFDTETTGTDPQAAELVGLAVAWETGDKTKDYESRSSAFKAPTSRCATSNVEQLPWEAVRAALQPVFADSRDRQGGAQRQLRSGDAGALRADRGWRASLTRWSPSS